MLVSEFDRMSDADAMVTLFGFCHCRRWAEKMLARRPFGDLPTLLRAAERYWALMDEPEWLEAFAGHARIGDMDKLRDKYSRSFAEQGQVVQADERVLEELLWLNRKYEAQNGFIFIVCASGKSAGEMRDILLRRLPNSRDRELVNAADEQAKIMRLRLESCFADAGNITEAKA